MIDNFRKQQTVLISASIASLIATLVTNPIEVAKTNMQYNPLNCQFYPHQNYKQLIRCSCSNFSFQGAVKSLKVAVPQIWLSNIMYMQLYEYGRHQFLVNYNFSPSLATISGSLVSRTFVSAIMLPLQTMRVKYSNSIKAKSLLSAQGLKVSLVRDLSYSGLYWSTLQFIRNLIAGTDYRSLRKQYIQQNFWSLNIAPPLIAGSLISAITTPLDTIKTRIQSDKMLDRSIIRQMMHIYKKQKFMGLFSGIHYRVIRNAISSTLYLSIYQWGIHTFSKKNIFNY